MIGRYISHIPAKHFKMVRFYGFLFSQKRGELLPKVYEALRMEERKKPEQPGFAALIKAFLHTDPYRCIRAATDCVLSALRPAETPRSRQKTMASDTDRAG
ncbi:TPA: transposase [Klebsiella oxytoca]|nr:transposase [Klebsiella oxytoca]